MTRKIKACALFLIITMLFQGAAVYAHDLAAVSAPDVDYSAWGRTPPPSAVMPTPEPTPTPTPVPKPTKFKEVEIARAITTYGTFASQASRNNNMQLAAKALDYTVIPNGGDFSYNQTLGPRTPERGYKKAMIFVGEEKEEGYGGGICQVSSTLYMAAKKANLQILERYPHTIPVTYCAREDEATVAWGYLDFRFRNNTGDPIRLEASCRGGVIKIIIFQRVPVY